MVLVDHSMGGQLAAEVAGRGPGRVRQVVLASATRDPDVCRVRQPVLVVRGEHDPVSTEKWARSLAGCCLADGW